MEGRELYRKLDRIAEAVEKLAEPMPDVKIEAGPPMCPSCGEFDPTIDFPPQGGITGLLSEVALRMMCQSCNEQFFVVIESYSCHRTITTAQTEITEREKGGFFQHGKVQ